MPENIIVIRKFKRFDLHGVFRLFSLNTGIYFDQSQKEDFEDFLDQQSRNYIVIELQKEIIASGGYNISYTKTAFISWIMVHPAYQRQGLGTMLLTQLLAEIEKDNRIKKKEALASQYSCKFFSKAGFNLIDRRENFWTGNIHLHKMQLILKKKKKQFGVPAPTNR